MALSILDGNQTVTTLSTILTSGAHIPAHTVVSLGTQAKTDITSAISGSVVSISNFPATQTIAGTVTANVTNSVTVGAIIGPAGGSCLQGISGSGDAVRIVLQGRDNAGNYSPIVGSGLNTFNLPVYGTVTVGNSVTIGSLPDISGTVTANNSGALTIVNSSSVTKGDVKFTAIAGAYNPTDVAQNYILNPISVDGRGISYVDGQYVNYRNSCVAELQGQGGPAWKAQLIASSVTVSNSVTIGSLPAISGTVTANLSSVPTHGVTIANTSVTVNGTFYQATQPVSLASLPSLAAGTAQIGSVTASISGTVAVSGTFYQATQPVSIASLPASTVTVSSIPAISGTVTANVAGLPKVTLIDGSSSVVTADSAIEVFATTTTRSYLLVQVTTGSAYVNVGATATTANGIYLASGQGYAWETTIPQGICSLISSVTGTAYCAKQA